MRRKLDQAAPADRPAVSRSGARGRTGRRAPLPGASSAADPVSWSQAGAHLPCDVVVGVAGCVVAGRAGRVSREGEQWAFAGIECHRGEVEQRAIAGLAGNEAAEDALVADLAVV